MRDWLRRGNPTRATDVAGACVDLAMAAAADTDAPVSFPKDGVALDSWANAWLNRVKYQPLSYFQDKLQLACGECLCHRDTSKKGAPTVDVPRRASGDNIYLFPEGPLWERGCVIERGDDLTARSSEGRVVRVKVRGSMPYISKNELHRLITDLPEYNERGRSGKPAQQPAAA